MSYLSPVVALAGLQQAGRDRHNGRRHLGGTAGAAAGANQLPGVNVRNLAFRSVFLHKQACNGLEETGIADAATWAALLGPQLAPVFDAAVPGSEPVAAVQGAVAADPAPAAAAPPVQPYAAPAWETLFSEAKEFATGDFSVCIEFLEFLHRCYLLSGGTKSAT